MNPDDRCPRCGEGRMKSWHELADEEQEVVKRLLGSAEAEVAERQRRHRWCSKCWYEAHGEETVA